MSDYFENARKGRSLVSSLEMVARHEDGYYLYTNNGRDWHRITDEQAQRFQTDLDNNDEQAEQFKRNLDNN